MNPELFLVAAAAVGLGAFAKGISGFGYSLISTPILASFIAPEKAVAFLILPLISVQLELLKNLEKKEVKKCVNSFEPYIAALTAGTLAGYYTISFLPANYVKIFLAATVSLFLVNRLGLQTPFEELKKKCFRRSSHVQLPVGLLSGIIFGATNAGIQIVAYLKTMDMDRRKFAGLLALVMVPISALRLPLASENTALILASIPAAVLGIVLARTGEILSRRNIFPAEKFSLILMLLAALRLIQTSTLIEL